MTGCPSPRPAKLFVGGAFVRSESGRTYEVEGANVALALPQGPARRRPRRPRRAPRLGRADRVQPRPGALPHRRDAREPPRRVRGAVRRRGRGRAPRSIAGSGTPAGRTSSRRSSARRTPSPARTSTSPCPEPVGVVGVVAPEEPPLDGLVSRLAPVLVGGNTAVVIASERHPLAAATLAEVLATSDVPGGRREHPHRPQGGARPRARRRTWT